MRLAVLRADPDGERTAGVLRRIGHDVLLAPLLRMMPLPVDFADTAYAAVLITSANAIRAIAAHPALPALVRLPVLAVGDRTAESARATGFVDVVSAEGDATDLVTLAAARFRGSERPLLYLAGEERATDVPAALATHGVRVETAVVYRMQAARQFPDALADALLNGALDGVLHYSPRSATIYLQCADGSQLRAAALAPRHFCLSEQVAAPFVAAGAAHVRVALQPDEASLLCLLDAD